jgi:hypothetical protein
VVYYVSAMFDYVKCSYVLPLSEEASKKIGPQDWEEIDFQTKSFPDAFMDVYSIEEDGQIYKENIDRELVTCGEKCEIKEKNMGIEKVDWTGELVFYYDFLKDDCDYWIEFRALIWKGELKEVEMLYLKELENESRIGMAKEMAKKLTSRVEREARWWWRFFIAWRLIVRFPLGTIRWCSGLISRFTWKIERWLTGGSSLL